MDSLFKDIFILGPNLPKPLRWLNMVSVDGTVIAIGGYGGFGGEWSHGDYSNSLYKLVCSQKCRWIELAQKLTVARYGFVAMTIPDEMTNCRAKVRTKVYNYSLESFFLHNYILILGSNRSKQSKANTNTSTSTKTKTNNS